MTTKLGIWWIYRVRRCKLC